MLSKEEKKAIERIEDFLTTNKIICISTDETADSEELKAFISKNEFLAIEFIKNMFLNQQKEIEELNKSDESKEQSSMKYYNLYRELVDKIKAKIKEYYEYDKRMQNKPDWHTTKYYEAKALEKLLED